MRPNIVANRSTTATDTYVKLNDYNIFKVQENIIDNSQNTYLNALIAKFPINTIDLANYCINNAKIADNTITSVKINNVDFSKILNCIITNTNITDNTINGAKIITLDFSKIINILINDLS